MPLCTAPASTRRHPRPSRPWNSCRHLLMGALAGCVSAPARLTRAQSSDRFTECSSAPHCVSSQAKRGSFHYAASFKYTGPAEQAHQTLLETLRQSDSARVEQDQGHFVHATFTSTLGFVDDVTFIIDPQRQVIDVKSSSRIGFSDLGVNGRRVERLRKRFASLQSSASS